MNENLPHYKIAMLGSCHVGKTSIVQRLINDQYILNTVSTTQSAFFQKKINVDKTEIVLDIWDPAGQERFHSLAPMYYRDADGVILVFDITEATSFAKTKQWVHELKEARNNGNLEIIIAANKNDLQSLRVVDQNEVKQYGKNENILICETSAKTGCFIKEIFDEIGYRVFQHKKLPSKELKRKEEKSCC